VGIGVGLGLGIGFGPGSGRGEWEAVFVPVPHDIARIIIRVVPTTKPQNVFQGAGLFILVSDECPINRVGVCTF
jgi:hypothetical protein